MQVCLLRWIIWRATYFIFSPTYPACETFKYLVKKDSGLWFLPRKNGEVGMCLIDNILELCRYIYMTTNFKIKTNMHISSGYVVHLLTQSLKNTLNQGRGPLRSVWIWHRDEGRYREAYAETLWKSSTVNKNQVRVVHSF